MAFERARLTL